MKPVRIKMAHHLLISYGVVQKMDVYRPNYADIRELCNFHTHDYIDFLRRVTPENSKDQLQLLQKFNIGPFTDCPVFSDLYDFCQLYAGGSIDGAMRLNHGLCDVAVNWAGGLHHAKKAEASGFCYVNDIVLAILELLKYHARVLYIDIDIHHGDGVEEAFYGTDRVMTLSFHKYGDFFPGTGALADIGHDKGKNYSVNVPLGDGLDDKSFLSIFKPIMAKVMEVYRPSAIVLQCGADSLTGDRLGCFNLTTRGHGEAVRYTRSFGVPTLVVGGGGYNIRNVARCWAYETSLCANVPLNNAIPLNDYYSYYAPDYTLHLQHNPDLQNQNNKIELEKIKTTILQNLSTISHAPSVQMHCVPPDLYSDFIYTAELPNLAFDPAVDNAPGIRSSGSGVVTYNNLLMNQYEVGDMNEYQNQAQNQVFHNNEFYDNQQDTDVLSNTRTPYGRSSSSRQNYHEMMIQGVPQEQENIVDYQYSI